MLSEVTVGGVTVSSNTETEAEMRASLGVDEAKEASEAAAKLGKRGGKAAAEARAKEKPDEPEPAEKPEPKAAKTDEASEGDEPDDESEKPKKDHRGDPRKDPTAAVRIAKREAKEARERAEKAERELAEFRTPKPKAEPVAKAAPDDDPEPNPDDAKYADGQFDRQFLKDQARWEARQELRENEAKKAAKTREDGVRQFHEERGALVDKAIQAEGGDDFLDTLSDDVRGIEPSMVALARGERPNVRHALGDEFLRRGEQAPRLMRYLTEHPDVFQRVTSPTLRPSQFEREMGRIDAILDAAATADTPRRVEVSKAKPPVRSVAGSPSTSERDGPDESTSLKGYIVQENRKAGMPARW